MDRQAKTLDDGAIEADVGPDTERIAEAAALNRWRVHEPRAIAATTLNQIALGDARNRHPRRAGSPEPPTPPDTFEQNCGPTSRGL